MYDSASCFLRPAYNCPHPMHAGDLPPLFVNNGRAWFATITPQLHHNLQYPMSLATLSSYILIQTIFIPGHPEIQAKKLPVE